MTPPVAAASLLFAVSNDRPKPFLLLLILALLGVADGIYLTLVHLDYEVGRVGLTSICSKFSATGCSITAGRFGDVFGIPVATVGLAGAAATATLATVAWWRRTRWEDPFRSGVLVLAWLSVAASLIMAGISVVAGAWCPFCVLWYGINIALAWAAWRCRDAHLRVPDLLDDAIGRPAMVASLVFAATVMGVMAWYNPQRARLEAERDDVLIPRIVAELRSKPAQSVDFTGLPVRGAEDPEVTIVEFGDFQCPYCRRLWQSVEQYAATSNRRVRVAFAHYPLDSSCNPEVNSMHVFACGAAIAAECARQQDHFWDYADELFSHQDALARPDLLGYATALGLDAQSFEACLDGDEARTQVLTNVQLGTSLGITGTPTFFINGRPRIGALPAEVLGKVIEGLLADG